MLLQEYLNAYPDPEHRPDGKAVLAGWKRDLGVNGVLMHHAACGCAHCGDTGYSGRAGLHELLMVDREQRHLIQTSARSETLQVAAMNAGMLTLRQDGIVKVLQGVTSIEEVRAISNS